MWPKERPFPQPRPYPERAPRWITSSGNSPATEKGNLWKGRVRPHRVHYILSPWFTVDVPEAQRSHGTHKLYHQWVMEVGLKHRFGGSAAHPLDHNTTAPPLNLEGKESCNAGDPCLAPGVVRFPGEGYGNPRQYSCSENPMDRGTWWTIVHGVAGLGMTEWLTLEVPRCPLFLLKQKRKRNHHDISFYKHIWSEILFLNLKDMCMALFIFLLKDVAFTRVMTTVKTFTPGCPPLFMLRKKFNTLLFFANSITACFKDGIVCPIY